MQAILNEGENRFRSLFADIVLETDPKEVIRKTITITNKIDNVITSYSIHYTKLYEVFTGFNQVQLISSHWAVLSRPKLTRFGMNGHSLNISVSQ